MEPVRADTLAPGLPLPHALYTRAGRLLAHSGTVLTSEMVAAIDPTGELRFDTRAEPLGVRPADAPPARPSGPLALSDEDRQRREWERRLIRIRAELRKSAAPLVQVARLRWDRLPLGVTVGLDPVVFARRDPASASRTPPGQIERALRERRAAGVAALRGLLARLLDGEHAAADLPGQIADDLIDAVSHEPEHYSILALGLPRPPDSLPDHAFTTGAIAIGIAAQLGWPRADVRAAGIAGMLCDCGMALVPYPLRRSGRELTEIEINALRRHADYSVALLRNVRGLPESVVLAAYQHHERGDGTGYPLGIRANQIHDYARVVAAADCFAGMTAPRAHRPARTPHAALSEMARLAAAGALDTAAVRALVDLVGLYPAGSFVKLSTGHVALVGASARPGTADRPTIHIVQPTGSPSRFGRAIDLRLIEPKALRVIEAVPAPLGV